MLILQLVLKYLINMANTIKTRPSVGDIIIIVDGKKRFVAGDDATSEFINQQQCLGVVYDVQGNYVRFIGGENNSSVKASLVFRYKITNIPSESGDYEVKLNNVVQGNFSYVKNDGSIMEFTTQLNSWLRLQPASAKAAKWEAYSDNEHSYLQMSTYDEYLSNNTIAGTTLSEEKLTQSPITDFNSFQKTRNTIKQFTRFNGLCVHQLESWVKNVTASYCNPTTEMNGTTQLFETYPCSKNYYDGTLGGGLRSHFNTYSIYIEACMARLHELNHGLMRFRDGKDLSDILKNKKVLINGIETYAFPYSRYVADYDCGIDGYGAGTFWVPSMYELGLLMKDITLDVPNTTLDKINVALSKKNGWKQIHTWNVILSSCIYSSLIAIYNRYGFQDVVQSSESAVCVMTSAFVL